MIPSDLTAATSIDELYAVYDANCEPFESLAQCDLFLRAASILRRRLPAETEGQGERIALRDLESAIVEARKARGAFAFYATPATVIVPPDELR